MAKKRKVKKSGTRSASAANRVAKTKKSWLVKRTSISRSGNEERKAGVGVIVNILVAAFVLIVGATFLAKYTGANKLERGHLTQDAPCVETKECASDHVCYGFSNNPLTCKERCKDDDECTEGHSCKAVVRLNKTKVKPITVCVSDDEL